MNNIKPWYKSRGIIGALAVIIIAIANSIGITLETHEVEPLVSNSMMLIGGIYALIGRIQANDKIGKE